MWHTLLSLFRPGNDAGANLDDLQQRFTGSLVWLAGAASAAVALLGLAARPVNYDMLGVAAFAIIVVFLVAYWNDSRPMLARVAMMVGWWIVFGISLWAFPQEWLPMLALPMIFACGSLLPAGDLASAAVASACVFGLTQTNARDYPLVGFTLAALFAVGLARLDRRNLLGALNLAWEMQRRTGEALAETRDRQAELKSVMKSLELATYQLESANRHLSIARQQAEEARRTKEQFAANISHELRTPLNVILGFSEMMYMSPEVYGDIRWPVSLRQDVYQIYRNSRHLLNMIDDVLELSRFELAGFSLRKERTDLAQLLANAIDIVGGLFRNRSTRILLEVEPGLPEVDVDRTRVRQVVINLLTNARKHADSGTIHVTARSADGEVVISVADNGPGIQSDKLPFVFDAFYQTDASLRREQGGVGLGLAISKRFVEAHNGRIWVESEVGVGTTFHFSLPVPAGGTHTLYPRVTDTPAPAQSARQPRIVVLDPDPAVGALVRRHVAGCEVVQAEDATELPEAMQTDQPCLVIANTAPQKHPSETEIALPFASGVTPLFLECSLPSRAWITRDLAVTDCLTKPVTAEHIYREVDQTGDIRDILIIDDDRGFGQLVERMLAARQRDYRVRIALDGAEGIHAMRDSAPDLVFLDLAMPVMDGFQVLEELRADPALSGIPVVLLTVTSYAEDSLRKHGSRIVLRRPGGLRLTEALQCIQGIASTLTA